MLIAGILALGVLAFFIVIWALSWRMKEGHSSHINSDNSMSHLMHLLLIDLIILAIFMSFCALYASILFLKNINLIIYPKSKIEKKEEELIEQIYEKKYHLPHHWYVIKNRCMILLTFLTSSATSAFLTSIFTKLNLLFTFFFFIIYFIIFCDMLFSILSSKSSPVSYDFLFYSSLRTVLFYGS